MPEFTKLLSTKSTMRYFPPKGTAGFARSLVSGESRVPFPPARTIPNTRMRIAFQALFFQAPGRRAMADDRIRYGFSRCAGFVQGRCARRPGFPAPVDPQTLVRVLADDRFEPRVQRFGIRGGVAGHWHRRIEPQNVPAFLGGPYCESGNDGCAAVGRQLRETSAGRRRDPEEIHKDAGIERGVLVDEDPDG